MLYGFMNINDISSHLVTVKIKNKENIFKYATFILKARLQSLNLK